MLHITNGDSAADLLKQAGLPGSVIPWRDALHEGPIFPNLLLNEESARRAEFVASRGWMTHDKALAMFNERDAAFFSARSGDEIVLWFEADLYDQLQLLQILNTLALTGTGSARISLICIDDYPGIDRFIGFGQLSVRQLGGLFPNRQPVTPTQLTVGMQVWKAFTGADPAALLPWAKKENPALPFLSTALRRFLQEFPAVGHGLSRNEYQIISVLDRGVTNPRQLFRLCQEAEEHPYLGDTIFWDLLTTLLDGSHPLVRTSGPHPFTLPVGPIENYKDPVLVLTPTAHELLGGREDWMKLRGVDRWFGGLHLLGRKPAWRWDTKKETLAAQL